MSLWSSSGINSFVELNPVSPQISFNQPLSPRTASRLKDLRTQFLRGTVGRVFVCRHFPRPNSVPSTTRPTYHPFHGTPDLSDDVPGNDYPDLLPLSLSGSTGPGWGSRKFHRLRVRPVPHIFYVSRNQRRTEVCRDRNRQWTPWVVFPSLGSLIVDGEGEGQASRSDGPGVRFRNECGNVGGSYVKWRDVTRFVVGQRFRTKLMVNEVLRKVLKKSRGQENLRPEKIKKRTKWREQSEWEGGWVGLQPYGSRSTSREKKGNVCERQKSL